MDLASATRPKLRQRLLLRSAETFSDDLDSFGETVPPRPRAPASRQDREDFCLRRLLVALHATGGLDYPVSVSSAQSHDSSAPDYVLRAAAGAAWGVEVTEATDHADQRHLTEAARDSAQRRAAGRADDIELKEVPPRDAPERRTAERIVAAIRDETARLQVMDAAVVRCDLLVYDNTEFGWLGDRQVVLGLVRAQVAAGGPTFASRSFDRVHLLVGSEIVLDLLGAEPLRLDLSKLHDADLAGWAAEQARLARERGVQALDLPNIAEELEFLGHEKRRARDSHLAVLLARLLKWTYQPRRRSRSWRVAIGRCRIAIESIIEQSPSLDLHCTDPATLRATLDKSYRRARKLAALETDLPIQTFPETCPFSIHEILDDDFLPETVSGRGIDA